jgi:hypothetical protein
LDYAKISLRTTRSYDSSEDNYYVIAQILPTVTVPIALQTSLLVLPGSLTVPETCARFATKTEIETLYTVLPATVSRFSAPSLALVLGGILPGDEIRVTAPLPPIWSYIDGVVVGDVFAVSSVISPTEVVVAPVFPDYAVDISYAIWRTGSRIYPPNPTDPDCVDGAANRNYGGAPALYYLAATHNDCYGSDLDAAMTQIANLEATAQGVVNEYNRDEFTGTDTEVFD